MKGNSYRLKNVIIPFLMKFNFINKREVKKINTFLIIKYFLNNN